MNDIHSTHGKKLNRIFPHVIKFLLTTASRKLCRVIICHSFHSFKNKILNRLVNENWLTENCELIVS